MRLLIWYKKKRHKYKKLPKMKVAVVVEEVDVVVARTQDVVGEKDVAVEVIVVVEVTVEGAAEEEEEEGDKSTFISNKLLVTSSVQIGSFKILVFTISRKSTCTK